MTRGGAAVRSPTPRLVALDSTSRRDRAFARRPPLHGPPICTQRRTLQTRTQAQDIALSPRGFCSVALRTRRIVLLDLEEDEGEEGEDEGEEDEGEDGAEEMATAAQQRGVGATNAAERADTTDEEYEDDDDMAMDEDDG